MICVLQGSNRKFLLIEYLLLTGAEIIWDLKRHSAPSGRRPDTEILIVRSQSSVIVLRVLKVECSLLLSRICTGSSSEQTCNLLSRNHFCTQRDWLVSRWIRYDFVSLIVRLFVLARVQWNPDFANLEGKRNRITLFNWGEGTSFGPVYHEV